MTEAAAKISITFKLEEKQPVMLISPDGYLPPWAVRGVLFLDTNITDKLVSGSTNKVNPWSTGWLTDHASDYLLSPLLWAYEQSYRSDSPAMAFSSYLAKATAAFKSQGYSTFSAEHLSHEEIFFRLDKFVHPTESQIAWLEYCVAAKLSAAKFGRREAVVAAAMVARDMFKAANLGLALFVGLLVVAGHHPSWRLVKGAPSFEKKAAANALLDLNGYLAYLLFRDNLAKTHRIDTAAYFSVWFATADKPLAHMMLNGGCRATFDDGGARVHFTLGRLLQKDLAPAGLAGFNDALSLIDESV